MTFITSASVNHHRASIGGIEAARFDNVDAALQRLTVTGASEAMILQTCNRVEIYAVSEDPDVLGKFAVAEGMPPLEHACGDDALLHLLRLAGGLDSMIIGEDQILGQLKSAYLLSEKNGCMGSILSTAVLGAIDAGRRARLETRINKGSVSIGSAAVELAEALAGDLKGRSILVVGAGEMGSLVANGLAQKNLKGIYVANRTFEQAQKLASSLGGVAVRLDDICNYIAAADVLICATAAPHLIITKKMVETCARRPLIIIDITNPRNVDEAVARVPGVVLHNIDSLRRINEANLERRRAEVGQVERIISEELARMKKAYGRQRADHVIGGLYLHADSLRLAELDRAVCRLSSHGGLNQAQKDILSEFSCALTGKILAAPARRLRLAAEKGDDEYLRTARVLFDLEDNDGLSGHKA
ncbi:glutamyl-tRNA reductase [Methanocella paludicola SANAE]|uniref:Glutamyl-tRNA reductase n=1 Tax=Methanocella paludicola (strain DSM 17711 / JCM 13418 / NBRC 101707 / SANAE) TaxID=304371 RepID=D1Z2S8_METPS|nr:glutamyl-tRNA reductase [Methanocella paludicola]BAI63000.1 glutamyl-tRNA reductase [Methanocella paludicola SANAE]